MLIALILFSSLVRAATGCDGLLWSDRVTLKRVFVRPPTESLLDQLTINRALGMTWASAFDNEPRNHVAYEAMPLIFGQPHARYRGRWTGPGPHATFQAHPANFLNQTLTPALGIPDSGFIFGMYLTDQEVLSRLGGDLSRFHSAHVRDAVGYLRYYVAGDDAVVVEIQSDLYRKLHGEDRRWYANWAKHLLYAFERHARDALKLKRVVIASPEYQARRWSEFHPDHAAAMYHHLPKRLGYRPTTHDGAYEWRGLVNGYGDVNTTLLPIGAAFAHDLSDDQRSGARRAWNQDYVAGFPNRWHHARAELARMEAAVVRPPARPLRFWGFARHYAVIGIERLPDDVLFIDRDARDTFDRLQQTLPAWVRALATQTVVSTGLAGATEDVVARLPPFGGVTATYRHSLGQERHASIDDGVDYLTIKGVGRRSLETDTELEPRTIAHCDKGEPSHEAWGGLLEEHGRHEFNAHLKLWSLATRWDITPAIARPVDLGWVDRVFNKGWLVDAEKYRQRLLPDLSDRLVQARYVAKSAARVSAITAALHSPRFGELIGPLLREAYVAAGEEFHAPPGTQAFAPSEDHAAALKYLARVAAINPGARRVLDGWAKRSLETIGLVHGLAGHWGGTGPGGSNGARHGGATQARNVSLAGELRDLDENVYLPGLMPNVWDRFPAERPEHVAEMQQQDLRHWQESYYWMSVLLLGRADAPEGVVMPRWMLGDPDDTTGLVTFPYTRTPEGLAQGNFLNREYARASIHRRGSDEVFKDPALTTAYRHGEIMGLAELLERGGHEISL